VLSLALGAGLYDVLTVLKSDPRRFPKLDVSFSSTQPLAVPVIVNLSGNGIRLRFDGSEQRLRLIEIIDLDRDRFTVRNEPLSPASDAPTSHVNLLYRRVYQLFGASYPGEYIKPADGATKGTYVVSYPGIALTFPIEPSAWSPNVDHAKMLSTSGAFVSSIALFEGRSWPEARKYLFDGKPAFPRSLNPAPRHKEGLPDEIEMIRVTSEGKLEVIRRSSFAVSIRLHNTTAQDLITDLGPPDAIYKRPNEVAETPPKPAARVPRRRSSTAMARVGSYGSTPSSISSSNTDTYDADFEGDDAIDGPDVVRGEDQYYCYFQHGLDVLLSSSITSNRGPAAASHASQSRVRRVVMHGNVPGSYPFNRHRRCRWSLDYIRPALEETSKNPPQNSNKHDNERHDTDTDNNDPITSETNFYTSAHARLLRHFAGVWPEKDMKEGMVLVRDWNGDSPTGSAVLIGRGGGGGDSEVEDEEEEGNHEMTGLGEGFGGVGGEQWLKNTRLYKFPGVMFEVMHNGAVSALTVY